MNRIKQLREENNITQIQLAKKLNKTQQTISLYENGTNEPDLDSYIILSKLFNRSIEYIAGKSDINIDSNVFPINDTPVKVPVVGRISAGLPILAQENIEGYEFAPSSMIKEGFEYFYLKVQGDSMNLKFNDGDIVLVQKQDELENNEIGVILVNGYDATVKKYKSENGLVILEPMSTNPENTVQVYNPKNISIKIIGKVVSYQGKI